VKNGPGTIPISFFSVPGLIIPGTIQLTLINRNTKPNFYKDASSPEEFFLSFQAPLPMYSSIYCSSSRIAVFPHRLFTSCNLSSLHELSLWCKMMLFVRYLKGDRGRSISS